MEMILSGFCATVGAVLALLMTVFVVFFIRNVISLHSMQKTYKKLSENNNGGGN